MATGAESAAAAGWLTSKLAPTIAGLFGGLSLAAFWTPEKLKERGKVAAIFIAGGVSAGVAFAFTGMVAAWLGVSPNDLDKVIALAYGIGLTSIAMLKWIANYIEKREHMDIGQVAKDVSRDIDEVKRSTRRAPRSPARKAAKR